MFLKVVNIGKFPRKVIRFECPVCGELFEDDCLEEVEAWECYE